MKKALIADDDEGILWVLEKFFEDKGFETVKAKDGAVAARLIADPSLTIALLDINMPGRDGLSILKEYRKAKGRRAPVIIMTADATMKNAIEAMKTGAADYITKPFDLDELEVTVNRVVENAALRAEVESLKTRLDEKARGETEFAGRSKAIEKVFKIIGKAAPQNATVLIRGESGTGKELVARIIHAESRRLAGPFIALNSAAVPRDLMESELFGHEKGAFTGAIDAKKGKFELASGGTLFLDEIGDMETGLQAKLLRAVQEMEFFRVGGKEPVKVDVRIIAATNQDLEKAVEEKRFREDLFHRINVISITLPPLRERRGDVPLLSEHFLSKFAAETGSEEKRLSKKAAEEMETYEWPGNVRELENTLRRAFILSQGTVITPEDLSLPGKRPRRESLEDMITERLRPFIDKTSGKGRQELYDSLMPFMERPLIKLVLKKTEFNQIKAAELLGINRNTLRKKIRDLKIDLKER